METHSPPLTSRKREILEKVFVLLKRGGLAGLTTKKIAREVGFSEPAIYRHFANKEGLLLGLMDLLEELLVDPMEPLARQPGVPAGERLLAMIRHHARLVLTHDSMPVLLLAESSVSNSPAQIQRMQRILARYIGLMEEVIRQGQEVGEVTTAVEADCLAVLLLGAPAALAIRHRLAPNPEAEERVVSGLLPFLIQKITPASRRAS